MDKVAIVGVGLIGGSFGLALRKAGFSGDLVGVSSSAAIDAGLRREAISRSATLAKAAAEADVIYLAQPIDRMLQTLQELAPLARSGCLVTDAGSTKAAIVEKASRYFAPGIFLGGHPVAGKERRGVEAADADLFRGRPYVLTPTAAPTSLSEEFRSWLGRIGARVVEMSPTEHDETLALTSHLPQLLSTALAATLAKQDNPHLNEIFGSGLLDMTRLALSPPDIWQSIVSTNQAQITAALELFLNTLLDVGNPQVPGEFSTLFVSASRFAAKLREVRYETAPPV